MDLLHVEFLSVAARGSQSLKNPRVAQRDVYLTEVALQTCPVLLLSFLMISEIPLADCYVFDEAGSWSGKPKKATSDGP